MVDVIAIGLIVGGAVLAFSGAALSSYGVGLLGAVIGGGSGYLLAPSIGAVVSIEGGAAIAIAIAAGAIIGIVATYALLSMAVAAICFLAGTYLGLVVLAPALVNGAWYIEWPAAIGIGIVAAFLGMVMTKSMMILLTAFVGAAFASMSIGVPEFEAAQVSLTVEPLLFDPFAPLFLGIFILGILSQFGLFKLGYVARVVAILPGARLLHNRGDRAGGRG